MRRTLLTAVLLLLCSGPTWSCMNDREVERSDADFRAAYGDTAADRVLLGRRIVLGALITLGVGAAGLTGAGIVLRRRELAHKTRAQR
jgi:hypothetical protein